MATTRKAPRKSSARRTSKANSKTAIAGYTEPAGETHTNGANPAEMRPGGATNGMAMGNGSSGGHAPEHADAATNGADSHQRPAEPTFEQIQLRAYHLYLARGCTHGADVNDWLTAERELRRGTGNA